MREQIVGLFHREGSVYEAAEMLQAAGYTASDLDLVTKEDKHRHDLPSAFRPVHLGLGRLMQRPEGMWPSGLRWALIGSVAVEVPVLIWVLLAFDSWAIQVFLGSTLWKFGTLFGGILGAIAGADRGLEANVARRYEEQLGHGALALAARVHHRDARLARGILIESGAFDVRNVEGSFIPKGTPTTTPPVPEPREKNRAQ